MNLIKKFEPDYPFKLIKFFDEDYGEVGRCCVSGSRLSMCVLVLRYGRGEDVLRCLPGYLTGAKYMQK